MESSLQTALIIAVSGLVGALIARGAALRAERVRQAGEVTKWRLDNQLTLYTELLASSQEARNNAYDAAHRSGQLDERHADRFRELASRAELLASQATLVSMRNVRDLIHSDLHAAELTIGRRSDPNYTTHHNEEFMWTDQAEWHRLRDVMYNDFRRDLGIEPANPRRESPTYTRKWSPN